MCLCVFLLITFVSPAKTAEPIEIPFGVDSRGPKEPCIRWGPDPRREEASWRCPAHWKALSVTDALYAAKKINNGASQRHYCSERQCCRLITVTLHCSPKWKICPFAIRPFTQILWPLVVIGVLSDGVRCVVWRDSEPTGWGGAPQHSRLLGTYTKLT